MMNGRRLAIFLPDLRGGGAERVAVNLANAFACRGYDVDLVLLAAEGDFLTDLQVGIRVVDLQVRRIRDAFIPLLRYLRKAKPQAMLACMWPLTVMAIWACKLARVPVRVVVAEHTTWSRSDLLKRARVDWQVRRTMHWSFCYAHGVIAVSQGAADDLAHFARLERCAIKAIYNPVVGESVQAEGIIREPAEWCTGSHYKLLAVGSLKPEKDYRTLLAAFSQLQKTVAAKLLILGEGECRLALKKQILELGIQNSVFMPGFLKNTFPYYKNADLHILSSEAEGFGNVIVEALAAGTPVVSTDCPSGPREILCDGQFGRLVPVGDATALAEAMYLSLTSSHDTAALKVRAQDFSIDKAVDQYEELLFPSKTKSIS